MRRGGTIAVAALGFLLLAGCSAGPSAGTSPSSAKGVAEAALAALEAGHAEDVAELMHPNWSTDDPIQKNSDGEKISDRIEDAEVVNVDEQGSDSATVTVSWSQAGQTYSGDIELEVGGADGDRWFITTDLLPQLSAYDGSSPATMTVNDADWAVGNYRVVPGDYTVILGTPTSDSEVTYKRGLMGLGSSEPVIKMTAIVPPVEDAQAAVDEYFDSSACTFVGDGQTDEYAQCLRPLGVHLLRDSGEASAIRIVSPPIVSSLGEATTLNSSSTKEIVREGTFVITFKSGVVEVLVRQGSGQYGWATVDLTEKIDAGGPDFNKVWEYTPADGEYSIEPPRCVVSTGAAKWTCSNI